MTSITEPVNAWNGDIATTSPVPLQDRYPHWQRQFEAALREGDPQVDAAEAALFLRSQALVGSAGGHAELQAISDYETCSARSGKELKATLPDDIWLPRDPHCLRCAEDDLERLAALVYVIFRCAVFIPMISCPRDFFDADLLHTRPFESWTAE